MFDEFVCMVRDLYGTNDFIPLHEPCFRGNEKKYVIDTIDSTFVSSVGAYVNQFESLVADYCGVKHAIATVNGTSALHTCLMLANVKYGDEVITQSLTFVATCNAIRYCGADPVFVDVDKQTLGMSPESLEVYLSDSAELRDDGYCWNKRTGKIIRACVPMHTFGHPVQMDKLKRICRDFGVILIEDAAESLGSLYQGHQTGGLAELGAFSFNGNKTITTGGGGMVITNNDDLARKAKHITTTAKIPHVWKFEHDRLGFNYRLPNLNAALGCAQMEELPYILKEKRKVAEHYDSWCQSTGIQFISEPDEARSNYWLNALLLDDVSQQNEFLDFTNAKNIMTRPVWVPMHLLNMNRDCVHHDMTNTEWLAERLVNIPSSVRCDG